MLLVLLLRFVERNGKTIHLLKQKSKEVMQQRKRMKREIFATPKEFKQMLRGNEEQKQEEVKGAEVRPAQSHSFQPPANNSGSLPNIIGNLEDL